MPAGSGGGCCCGWNMAKVDPSTGSVPLQVRVIGDGTITNPQVWRIEPLRGTNDLLVGIMGASPSSSQLCRIDNTGAQIWVVTGMAVLNTGQRYFGSDGTYIICMTPTGLVGLNYSGSIVWTLTISNVSSINVAPAGTFTRNNTSPQMRLYDSSSGSVITTAVNGNDCNPQAVDPSSSNVYINNTSLGGSQILNSTYGFVRSIAYNLRDNCRWNAGGISYHSSTANNGLINPSTGALVWSNSGNAGLDTDNDSTGCYFTGSPQTISGVPCHLYKKDISTGSIIWGALQFSAVARAVAVGGGGWIYCGGPTT